MRGVTIVLACIAALAMTCTATTDNDVLLPNLDSGLSIDENNVELIQVKESNKGSETGTAAGESDEELFKEGTTSATGLTGATGATGMTGSHAKKVEKKKPTHVSVVTFKGKKHTKFKCRTCLPPPDPNMPVNYKKRRAMRKAKQIVADVLEGFPDKIYSHPLSAHARCVDSDPYFSNYKNPIGLINPTKLRRVVRRAAEDNRESMLGHMSDMHVGAKAVLNHLVEHGYKGVETEAQDEGIKDSKDMSSVDFALNTTEFIRDAILSQEFEDALNSNNKLKEQKQEEEKADDAEAEKSDD